MSMILEDPRFFIDHGVVHDRVTGQHVGMEAEPEHAERLLALLNSLYTPLAWLVRLKDMKDGIESGFGMTAQHVAQLKRTYEIEKPMAWEVARLALEGRVEHAALAAKIASDPDDDPMAGGEVNREGDAP